MRDWFRRSLDSIDESNAESPAKGTGDPVGTRYRVMCACQNEESDPIKFDEGNYFVVEKSTEHFDFLKFARLFLQSYRLYDVDENRTLFAPIGDNLLYYLVERIDVD